MGFPFKAIGFDWANTLVSLGEECDRSPLEKVFTHLEEKQITLPDFEVCLKKSRELFRSMIELSRTTHMEARYEEVLQYLLFYFKIPWKGKVSLQELLQVYYREVYREREVFPEVKNVLQQLSEWDISMGIISNTTNPVFMKELELEDSGLKKYFDFTLSLSQAAPLYLSACDQSFPIGAMRNSFCGRQSFGRYSWSPEGGNEDSMDKPQARSD